MADVRPQPRFSIAVHAYLWIFFALLTLLPPFVVTETSGEVPFRTMSAIAAFIWLVSIALLFLYVSKLCSGDAKRFYNGLLWVTASMMTGWTYLSFATVFPALLVAFFGAVFLAFFGDLRRDRRYATERWVRLVQFFYRHRMRQ